MLLTTEDHITILTTFVVESDVAEHHEDRPVMLDTRLG